MMIKIKLKGIFEFETWVRKNEVPNKIECENKINEINDFTKKYF